MDRQTCDVKPHAIRIGLYRGRAQFCERIINSEGRLFAGILFEKVATRFVIDIKHSTGDFADFLSLRQ